MKERGFLMIGSIIMIAILSASLGGMGWLYNGALKEKARVQGEYEAFKEETRRLGEAAEKRNQQTLVERERIANERIASLGKRVADARARADGLCKSAGLSAGCRALPATPETTRPTDAAEFNSRLLEVLRHAQAVADRLAELQLWVQAQQPAQ